MRFAQAVGGAGIVLSVVCWWLALRLPAAPSLEVSTRGAETVVVSSIAGREVPVRALRSTAGQHELRPVDLIEEPDILPSWEEFHGFFDRQTALTEVLSGAALELQTADGTWVAAPVEERGPLSLPWQFYLQVLVGLFMWMVGVATYAYSDRQEGARGYAISALAMGIVIWPAAVYSTRPLAMDGVLFRALSTIDHIGGIAFGIGILIMMIAYPTRLFRGARWLWLLLPFGIVAEYWPFAPKKLTDFYAVMASQLVCLAVVSIWQWLASRRDPVARAAFSWTLLSVLLGLATFVVLIELPYWLGLQPFASQAISLSAISLMFAGISLGILKYRLFDLDRWWFRTWTWLGGGALVVAIDLTLVSAFDLGGSEATMITLAVVGWLYFPVRQWVLRRISYREARDESTDAEALLSATDARSVSDRLEDRLRAIFAPLRITTEEGAVSACELDALGTRLLVPRVIEPGHFACYLKSDGHRLYSTEDLKIARRLVTLATTVHRALLARTQGADAERSRIRRDLHDDLGASIVRIIHSTDDPKAQAHAKVAMSDLRNVLVALAPKSAKVGDALARIEVELRRTVELAGGALTWRTTGDASWVLTARAHANLTRIMREATTNAVRHGDGQLVCTITVDEDGLVADLENPCHTTASDHGLGLANMAARMQELGGDLRIVEDGERFRLSLRLPQEAGG